MFLSIDNAQETSLREAENQTIPHKPYKKWSLPLLSLLTLVAFTLGIGSGYLLWGTKDIPGNREAVTSTLSNTTTLLTQIYPAQGYPLPVPYGKIGPDLLGIGAIDFNKFNLVYSQASQSLTSDQVAILTTGSDQPVLFNQENAYFLLNFFWALGLSNNNPVLTEGQMVEYSQGNIGRFASTGGWTLGALPATELYASITILPLTVVQQNRLEKVIGEVYRPCCNNPTSFPDCNHGMAMLGLLELLAFHDASEEEMFNAAKYANAYWFPQQTLEQAILFKQSYGLDFADINARLLVGRKYSSGTGFQTVHQWLANNNLLPPAPQGTGSCDV